MELPGALRQGNWSVTAALWLEKEILAVFPGEVEEAYGLAVDVGIDHRCRLSLQPPDGRDRRFRVAHEPPGRLRRGCHRPDHLCDGPSRRPGEAQGRDHRLPEPPHPHRDRGSRPCPRRYPRGNGGREYGDAPHPSRHRSPRPGGLPVHAGRSTAALDIKARDLGLAVHPRRQRPSAPDRGGLRRGGQRRGPDRGGALPPRGDGPHHRRGDERRADHGKQDEAPLGLLRHRPRPRGGAYPLRHAGRPRGDRADPDRSRNAGGLLQDHRRGALAARNPHHRRQGDLRLRDHRRGGRTPPGGDHRQERPFPDGSRHAAPAPEGRQAGVRDRLARRDIPERGDHDRPAGCPERAARQSAPSTPAPN